MAVMTIPECEKWLANCNVKLTKWGWMPVHKKLAKYIRDKTKKEFRGHKTPDGQAWAKAEFWEPKKKLSIGTKAEIAIENRAGRANFGKPYKRVIKTEGELKAAQNMQWRPEALKKSHKAVRVPALYRKNEKKGIKAASDLYTWINEAGRRNGSGGPVHQGKFHFRFGLLGWRDKYAEWFYGTRKYRGSDVKARPFLGLNKADVDFVMKAYADHAMKRIGKKNSD